MITRKYPLLRNPKSWQKNMFPRKKGFNIFMEKNYFGFNKETQFLLKMRQFP
jgi:hypothetical protein